MKMTITLRGGTQLRADVSSYEVIRDDDGALHHVVWTTPDDAETALEYVNNADVIAVHTELTRKEAQQGAAIGFGGTR